MFENAIKFIAVSVTALACMFASAALRAADVTGTWAMDVQTTAGSGGPTFVLAQKGDNVTGTYRGQLGEAPVSGTVKGNEIKLTFKVSGAAGEALVEYSGKVDGDTMNGNVKLGDFGTGTFSGKKK